MGTQSSQYALNVYNLLSTGSTNHPRLTVHYHFQSTWCRFFPFSFAIAPSILLLLFLNTRDQTQWPASPPPLSSSTLLSFHLDFAVLVSALILVHCKHVSIATNPVAPARRQLGNLECNIDRAEIVFHVATLSGIVNALKNNTNLVAGYAITTSVTVVRKLLTRAMTTETTLLTTT